MVPPDWSTLRGQVSWMKTLDEILSLGVGTNPETNKDDRPTFGRCVFSNHVLTIQHPLLNSLGVRNLYDTLILHRSV